LERVFESYLRDLRAQYQFKKLGTWIRLLPARCSSPTLSTASTQGGHTTSLSAPNLLQAFQGIGHGHPLPIFLTDLYFEPGTARSSNEISYACRGNPGPRRLLLSRHASCSELLMLNLVPLALQERGATDFDATTLDEAWRSYTNPVEPIFTESVLARLRRWVLGMAYALRPSRIGVLPRLWLTTAAYFLRPKCTRDRLPVRPTCHGRRGFVGVSDDLAVGTMIERYRQGLTPISHVGRMKWWFPAERAVIAPHELRLDQKTRRLLRQGKFFVTFDEDFVGVIEACAEPRSGKTFLTWITPKMMHAVWALHEAGYAHSVEVWDDDCHLIGGLYGLAIGGVCFAESRFARVDSASEVGVAVLHQHLAHWGFGVHDAKCMSPHLASLGFRTVDREVFQEMLKFHAWKPSRIGRWTVEEALGQVFFARQESD
jgi:leucyl/phenylalanyl-tRNA--protein transferase